MNMKNCIGWLAGILISLIVFCNMNELRSYAAEVRLPDRSMTGIQSSMPTQGTVHVLVLAVEFPDKKFDRDIKTTLEVNMFERAGTQWIFKPYDSVTNYYARSSFYKLDLQGEVYTFTASQNREKYEGNQSELINEVFASYRSEILTDVNAEDKNEYFNDELAKYDENKDHVIDGIYLYCAGGAGSSPSSQWWNRTGFYGGYSIGDYSVGSLCFLVNTEVNLICHETGHMLGLPDYGEDSNDEPSVISGIAGNDMMNNKLGDHTTFSKILLGWIDQDDIRIITGELEKVQLSDCAGEGKCAVVVPEYREDQGLLTKFLLVDYFDYTENNELSNYNFIDYQDNKGGLRVYQVDAELNESGQFLRENKSYFSKGAVPLIRQIHADAGREHCSRLFEWYKYGVTIGNFRFISAKMPDSKINMNGCLFHSGDELTPYTLPSSCLYGESLCDMNYSGAYVKNIEQADSMVSFVAGIEKERHKKPVTYSVDSTTGNTYISTSGPWDQIHFSTDVIPADMTKFYFKDGCYSNDDLTYLQDKKGEKIYDLRISISSAERGVINITAIHGRNIQLKEGEEYEIVIPEGTLSDPLGNVLDDYKIDFSTKNKYEKTTDFIVPQGGIHSTVRCIDRNGSGILINFLWSGQTLESGMLYVVDHYKIIQEKVCPDELLRAIKYYDNKMWRNQDGTFTIAARDTEERELICVTFDTSGDVITSYSLEVDRYHNSPYGVINNEKGYILVGRTLYFLNRSSYEKRVVFDASVGELEISENGAFVVKIPSNERLYFYDADANLINSMYIGYDETNLYQINVNCFVRCSSGYLLSVDEYYDYNRTYCKYTMWQFDENCRLVKKYDAPKHFHNMVRWDKGYIGRNGKHVYLMDFSFNLVDVLKYVTDEYEGQIHMRPDNNLSVGYCDLETASNATVDLSSYDDSAINNIRKIDGSDKPEEPAGGSIELSSNVMATEYEKETGYKNIKWYNLDGVYITDDTYMTISNKDGSYCEYFYFDIKEINTNQDIVKEHFFGDLKFTNITLYKKEDTSFFECDVTNGGLKTFQGILGFSFYNDRGQRIGTITSSDENRLLPGEIKKITGSNSLDLTQAACLEISMEDADISINKRGITQKRTIENILQMDDIRLFSNRYNLWTFECRLSMADDIDQEMRGLDELYITFRNDDGTILLDKPIKLQMEDKKDVFLAFYTHDDLKNASYLEVRTVPQLSPTPNPTAMPTPNPTATPTPDPTALPTNPPTMLPSKTTMPAVIAEPAKNPTATSSPTAKPTPGKARGSKVKKLKKPTIRIITRRYNKNMWIARIRLKKYQGTYVEIYYRRGKGKFCKIKLRQANIKKNKGVFKIGYKDNRKKTYIRIRTYYKKKKKKIYSKYSSIYRLKI